MTGDFNRDGILDLAITYRAGALGGVSILLGKGDGTFGTAQNYATGLYPSSVAVADFNGDGISDLVVTNGSSSTVAGQPPDTVSILLGNGDGSFGAAASFPAGYGPVSVAVGDFNGDGKLDLVTTNYSVAYDRFHSSVLENDMRVYLGNGDGTFQPPQVFPAGDGPISVAVADVNADGIADLVVANSNDYKVSVLLGNGDGTFQPPRNYAAGGGPWSVVVADFNRDNYADVAVANHIAPGAVTILINAADWGR